MSLLITLIMATGCSVDFTLATCKWQVKFASQDNTTETLLTQDREALITQWNFLNVFPPIWNKVRGGDNYGPSYRWNQELPFVVFNDNMLRNGLLGSDVVISPLDYKKMIKNDDHNFATTMPDEIFLDCWESFQFVASLTIDEESLGGASSFDELWITLEVSNENLLYVRTKREVIYVNSSVKYQVTIVNCLKILVADKGSLQTQLASGIGDHLVSVLMKVWMSQFKCSASDGYESKQLQGSKSLSVHLGCLPNKHLVFDITATLHQVEMMYGEIYDCPTPDPEYPCFYYKHAFNPVLRVLDVVTGKSSLFTGQYNMKVIGGSAEGPGSIQYFDGEQLQQFNLQNRSGPTIWKPDDAKSHSIGPVPILQHNYSGIVWRCEQGSPCASVPMHFPWPPEYYFVMEVTNRLVDTYSTYCEYSTQFTIKVHGLELSKYDLMAIVGWSLAFSLVFIAVFVICRQHKIEEDAKHPRQPRKTSQVVPMPTVTEGEISDDSETEEVINIEEGQGLEEL